MTKRKCPNCSRKVDGHPNKKFCNLRCKDKYHNRNNPRGYGLQMLRDRDHEEAMDADGFDYLQSCGDKS